MMKKSTKPVELSAQHAVYAATLREDLEQAIAYAVCVGTDPDDLRDVVCSVLGGKLDVPRYVKVHYSL